MRLRRWAGVVLGLALPALAAGCADSDDPPARKDAGADAAGDTAQNDTATGSDAAAETDATGGDVVQQPGLPCAPEGKAAVAELQAGQGLQGPEALGRPGDWLLTNDVAAFVIQRADAKPQPCQQHHREHCHQRFRQRDVAAHQRHAQGQCGVGLPSGRGGRFSGRGVHGAHHARDLVAR